MENSSAPLIDFVHNHSPYLSRLLTQYPHVMDDFLAHGADKTFATITEGLAHTPYDQTELMHCLRVAKGKSALLIALADITEHWNLSQITLALSTLAERCLTIAIDAILHKGHRLGEITLMHPDTPSKGCGIVVLGMGKLGGFELNYSSDIDLIILYEPELLRYNGRHNEQHFMNRLAHDLVTIMQERTAQGYVFRTDLRLRPDPASTPPAVTINAAYYYYESVGQNWERAAMIKARPVAGDIVAGEQFLKGITPFMWRRNLDFAAINDIHSIKRQMDSRQNSRIELKGHNIKLGLGGIREIEFYAQIHQLIWGGREPVLRTRATCETLSQLAAFGLIDHTTKDGLIEAYLYLRKLEHRLQMIQDEQTHSLPETAEGLAKVASFMGHRHTLAFEETLIELLQRVHAIYASSFKKNNDPSNSNLGAQGNLVFTGTVHDPNTLETLRVMGFNAPETVSEMVMNWHHGSCRATRTKRARELLTELMPNLLGALAKTSNPDAAFLKFSEFLAHLPAGIQLFSLFQINPHLLTLVADIMGSAPMLADTLRKMPSLIEAVLYEDFYEVLPSYALLKKQLDELLASVKIDDPNYYEACMDHLCRFRNEKYFQAGVHFIKHMVTSHHVGRFLSDIASVIIEKTLECVTAEFVQSYGTIKDSHFAIIALGKLGSCEMTFSSDIDLVFVYDVPDFDTLSDGEKSFGASVYFNRLAQRFIGALTAMGNDGRLYEVDTRLRPSGAQGLLAVSTQALTHYFSELAWTFEYMAFTKARVVAADSSLMMFLDRFIIEQLCKTRDSDKLRSDVIDMRERIAKEHKTTDPWNIKYVCGGLMDIDFIAQYLLLLHAPTLPDVKPGDASYTLMMLEKAGRISAEMASELCEANRLMNDILHMLRLCSNDDFDPVMAPEGLKKLLVESTYEPDFSSLSAHLIQVEQNVHARYIALLL
jgi:[glutamine synthetase] adenylyltransferase / [glutamine synthetase]-adenylyl-L-tyrosine phosphorylase